MKHGLYGVFKGPKWAMCRSRKVAIKAARRARAEVRRMDLPASNGAWDAPTFYMLSDRIADFRAG